ncbi:MAG: hypothetical protein HY420_04655 [Candidatus Kerfeldbacteria bacterium]|nr:hypothetical protein [Candidatus Kerfeldbacteria bacterium]
MSSAPLEPGRGQWFGTASTDGDITVSHKHANRFIVHGLWNQNQKTHEVSYTVVAYFPDGWPLKQALFAAAQQFVVPLSGKVEHGPCAGAPHAFGVVIPVKELRADPCQQYPWLGQCLFNALLAAVEQASQPASS